MNKEIFATTLEELENLQCTHQLEFCGMSGAHYGWQWFSGVDADLDVYFRLEE